MPVSPYAASVMAQGFLAMRKVVPTLLINCHIALCSTRVTRAHTCQAGMKASLACMGKASVVKITTSWTLIMEM